MNALIKKLSLFLTGALLYAPVPLFAASVKENLCAGSGACNNNGDPTTGNDLVAKIGKISEVLITVAGAVAVIVIIIGGIRYMTSTGDATRVKAAKDTIFYAVIGLVVAILAYAIVHFVSTHL